MGDQEERQMNGKRIKSWKRVGQQEKKDGGEEELNTNRTKV